MLCVAVDSKNYGEALEIALEHLSAEETAVIELSNSGSFVNSVIAVVERIKRQRSAAGFKTHQANLLEVGAKVYAPEDPEYPLDTPKLRYRIPRLTIRLSPKTLTLDNRAWTSQV